MRSELENVPQQTAWGFSNDILELFGSICHVTVSVEFGLCAHFEHVEFAYDRGQEFEEEKKVAER